MMNEPSFTSFHCSNHSLTPQFCPRSPVGTTLLPSSARRWARQRTRRGSRVDLWTCSTSSCRQTPGAGSAAMTTTSRTCRDPSWSDRWPKSAWWGREDMLEGWMEAGRGWQGWTQGSYYEWFCAIELHCCLKMITHYTSMSDTVALGGIFLNCQEHIHCSLFWLFECH